MAPDGAFEDKKCPRCGAQPLVWRKLVPGEAAALMTKAIFKSLFVGVTHPTAWSTMISAPTPKRLICVACEAPVGPGYAVGVATFFICPFCDTPNKHVVYGGQCLNCNREYF